MLAPPRIRGERSPMWPARLLGKFRVGREEWQNGTLPPANRLDTIEMEGPHHAYVLIPDWPDIVPTGNDGENFMKMAILLAGALTLACTGPLAADPGKNNAKGNGNSGHSTNQKGGKQAHKTDRTTNVRSDRYDRTGRMYALDTTGRCPPGLAKKNNGCTPPGQAKKLYNVGQRYNRNFGNAWTYDQIPTTLRSQYNLNDDDRYYYNQGYLYQVDPKTLVIEKVISAILR